MNSLLAFHHCFLIIDTKEVGERTKFSLTVFFTECLNNTIFGDKIILVFTHACHIFAASQEALFPQNFFMKRVKRLNISIAKINNTPPRLQAFSLCSLMPVGWQPLGAAMGLEVSNSLALFTLLRFHQQTLATGQT